MVRREKSRDIPGSYQVVFEACVRTIESFEPPSEQQSMMGIKRLLRIQSANAQAGTITAKLGEAWHVEIHVPRTEGKCSVSVNLPPTAQGPNPLAAIFHC